MRMKEWGMGTGKEGKCYKDAEGRGPRGDLCHFFGQLPEECSDW